MQPPLTKAESATSSSSFFDMAPFVSQQILRIRPSVLSRIMREAFNKYGN
jgi:hypothetical protein